MHRRRSRRVRSLHRGKAIDALQVFLYPVRLEPFLSACFIVCNIILLSLAHAHPVDCPVCIIRMGMSLLPVTHQVPSARIVIAVAWCV